MRTRGALTNNGVVGLCGGALWVGRGSGEGELRLLSSWLFQIFIKTIENCLPPEDLVALPGKVQTHHTAF